MKRIGYLFDKICDQENIRKAIRNASKGKRDRHYVRRVLRREDEAIEYIANLLKSGQYTPKPNRTKTIRDGACGKIRNITIPAFFPDQIIQWAVIQVLEPEFHRSMYRYCCGSVPGRGCLDAKKYVERMLRKKDSKYVMQLDIRKFFPSASSEKMKELLARRIKDRDVLKLLGVIIDHGGEGLPIGYYSSQWLSNFYLQKLDHFIKEELRIPYYVRYVDDMILAGPNKRKLHKARLKIQEYLESNQYGVSLKDNWQLWRKNTRPLDFLGYRFYEDHTRMRKRLFYHLMRTVRRIRSKGLNEPRARRFLSLIGWGKHIPFKEYYLSKIRPIVSQKAAKRYISRLDKRRQKGGCQCAMHSIRSQCVAVAT